MKIVFVSAGGGGGGGVTAVTGVAPITSSGGSTPAIGLTTPLSIANGGNGTATPTLTAGTNVTITGSWPNYTISASGGGTVTTDGVTIQGNGTGGSPIALLDAITDGVTLQGAGISSSKLAIKAVQVNARLTGAGTVASPLDISGWPLPGFVYGLSNGTSIKPSTNTLALFGFVLPAAVTFAHLFFYIATADGVNNSDLGLYNAAGTLIANVGAQTFPTAAAETIATLQGSQTIPPGQYWFAFTTAGSAFAIYGNNTVFTLYSNTAFGSSSGGALPSTITPPALSPAFPNPTFGIY